MIIDDKRGEVRIKPTAHIESTAVIIGPATIQGGAYVGHNAIVGAPPQYKGYWPQGGHGKRANAGVYIGAGTVVRELCQVHQGVQRTTFVGDDCLLMAGCHIAHDSSIGAHCTLGSFSTLGGHTTLGGHVTFGQGVVTHPWVIVGAYSMVGLNSSVIEDVLPYQKVAGSPARLLGKNTGAGGDKQEWNESCFDETQWVHYDALRIRRNSLKKEMRNDGDPER